jgi:hypothetical protein
MARSFVGDFEQAIKFLRNIPNDTLVYAQAQVKLNEYTQKQRLRTDYQKVASAKRTDSFVLKTQVLRLNIFREEIIYKR